MERNCTKSRSFLRAKFDHVEEHVIYSDDPKEDQSISLTGIALNFLSIDIANLDMRIGIEVDGPAHFINIVDHIYGNSESKAGQEEEEVPLYMESPPPETHSHAMKIGNRKRWKFRWNGRRQENGPTALKHRLLCHLGWRVVHMPFWEWNMVAGDVEEEELYCKELLDEVMDE